MPVLKLLPRGGFCLLFVFCRPAMPAPGSSLSAEAGGDNNGGKSYYVSATHTFDPGVQISASGENSQVQDSSGIVQRSKYYDASIHTDPSDLFSTGLSKSRAQQSDNLTIDSVILPIEFNTQDWNLFVSIESREIELATNINLNTYRVGSDGYSYGFTYYGWDPFFVSWRRSNYDYPAKISAFNSRPQLNYYIFGSDTIDSIFALEDVHDKYDVGYFFTAASISFGHSRGRSVVDESITTVNEINFNYMLSSNWSIMANAGNAKTDSSSSSTTFGSLGISYYW